MAAGATDAGPGVAIPVELRREQRMVCVEYPGVVRDVSKMLSTLGGEEGVSRIYGDPTKRLELYFRPKDPYCHPVCANRFSTSSLLLRVRRKTKRQEGLPGPEAHPQVTFDVDILGIVPTIYRFQGMSDFQYLAVHTEAGGVHKSMYDKVLMVRPEKEDFFHQELPLYIPPPIFSRLDTPADYFYRPETQHREGYNNPPISGENLIGLSRARRLHNAIFVNFEGDEVPEQPLEAAVQTWRRLCSNPMDRKAEEELRKLFDIRPIWSRNAVRAKISVHPDKLKVLLPFMAYYMITGPWRSLWIRFGYDPRRHPEAKIYQVLDFRIRCGMKSGYTSNEMPVKAKRSTYNYSLPITVKKSSNQLVTMQDLKQGLGPSGAAGMQKSASNKYKLKDSVYIFREGALPPYRQMFYQLCDLNVEELQKIIHRNDGAEETCTERDGWCLPKTSDDLRNAMSLMIRQIIRARRPALFSSPAKTDGDGRKEQLAGESGEEEEEEEEEEEAAAALDLSVNPASIGGRLVFSGPQKKSSSSLASSSSQDSISSDSETSEPLSCQGKGQTGVLTAHSFAREDGRVAAGEPCTRKKRSATRSISERELAEVANEYMFSLEENKKSKGRRQPLSKLPRHHPLVLQDCGSDDETSEQLTPEEEAEETEAWAKPLSQLWQNRPPNFEAEKEFNETMAQQAPHCSVCMIFQTYHQVEFGGLSQNCADAPDLAPQRQRTKPLIPEMCFTTTGCSTDINLSTPYLEEDGTSILVSCKKCSVRVHASCYGVPPAKASEDWMCSRCSANALEEDCCLCSLRGGALQRANDDRWVHVSCAVAILEARFVNIAARSPVDVSKIPLPRFKLKCVFCKKRRKRTAGCCVQCSHGRCPTAFHVSCAQAAGVMMQPDDWPFVVFITCFRHRIPNLERAKGALQSITAGQKVISKHKNGRFYQCEVVRLTTETFYEVNFDDGSFSDNLYPEDIVSQDCLQLGPPAEGEVVQVRWTDGQVYGAKFVASHPIQMYQVEFEDGSQLVVKRDDVYTLDEELPKRVKSRLSVASDMRFNEIFTEKEVKQEKKRQRVINSRYREDYIEPALYRAIME